MPASSSGDDVLDRAVGRVAGHLVRPELAPEADPPEQVAQRHVLHHVGRGDQGGEDDAAPCRRRRRSGRGSPGPSRCWCASAWRRGRSGSPAKSLVRSVAPDRWPVRVEPPLLQQLPGRVGRRRTPSARLHVGSRHDRPAGRSAARLAQRRPRGWRHRRRRGRPRGPWPRSRSGGRGNRGRRWPRPWWRRSRAPGPRPGPPPGRGRRSARRSAAKTSTPSRCRMRVRLEWSGSVLVEGVAEVPAVGEVEAGRLDELALGADALEEHDELQLEEDDRVDARPAPLGVELPRPVADEAEVELGLQVAVEVAPRDQVLQRDGNRLVEAAGLGGPSIGGLRECACRAPAVPQPEAPVAGFSAVTM